MVVPYIPDSVCHQSARVGRDRKFGCDVHRRLADQCWIDAVVDERGPQRKLPAGVARGRGCGGEVTHQHRRCRNKGLGISRIFTKSGPLVTSKEKQFVLDDRATKSPAKLVALQRIVLGRKIIPGIEQVVADEFK